jgi:hypothetical protein
MTFGTISKGLPLAIIPGGIDFIAALVGDHFYNENKFFSMHNITGALKVSIPATIGYAWTYGRVLEKKQGYGIFVSLGAAGVYAVIELVQHRKGDGNKGMEFAKDFAFAGVINIASQFAGTAAGVTVFSKYFNKYLLAEPTSSTNYYPNSNTIPSNLAGNDKPTSFYPNTVSNEDPEKNIGNNNLNNKTSNISVINLPPIAGANDYEIDFGGYNGLYGGGSY